MPSHLRLQSNFEAVPAQASYQTSPASPPAKKQKMSLTQTYYVASTARSKLGREANRADHNLRLLVGHANLLDQLMLDLSEAERSQEAWFNQSIQKASKPEQPKHIQWLDQVAEEDAETGEESEEDSDYEDDAEEIFNIPVRRISQPPIQISSEEIEDEFDEDFDEDHALTRVPSSRHSPPELMSSAEDSDSESEDESMPSSPEHEITFELSEKQREAITTTAFYDAKTGHDIEEYFVQQAQQPQAPLIAAY